MCMCELASVDIATIDSQRLDTAVPRAWCRRNRLDTARAAWSTRPARGAPPPTIDGRHLTAQTCRAGVCGVVGGVRGVFDFHVCVRSVETL